MKIRIKHSTGTTQSFDTLAEAMHAVADIYGAEVVMEGSDGGRILVWQGEELALDDDGSKAVASISTVVEE